MTTAVFTVCLMALAAEAPQGEADRNFAALEVEGLRAEIGDNAAHGEHLHRYNGVHALFPAGAARNMFVPKYAGLNLEHYFDATDQRKDGAIFFEPRNAPMSFERVDETAVELYQPPTPRFGVESWTRFTLRPPHTMDMRYRCMPCKRAFEGGFLGVFWASYINAPEDKSIYFLAGSATLEAPRWVQFCTQVHGRDSTVRAATDTFEPVVDAAPDVLYASHSPLRYALPFFYGRTGDHVLIYLFRTDALLRFAHSPSGGGATDGGDDTNPAWDFQMLVPDYAVDQEYRIEVRLLCKPWRGRSDVLAEARAFFAE